jgi:uncharacterized membrane protein HdeD (DUF308 family)
MNDGEAPLKKSWQRWTWLMAVTFIAGGLIVYDASLTGKVSDYAIGAFISVVTLAANDLFKQHAKENEAK